jgi:hypothetical protein
LWATWTSCTQLSHSWLCTTHTRWWSWRIWRIPRWFYWRKSCSNLLQMWWTQSLCSRLSGSGHEVLRLRKTGKPPRLIEAPDPVTDIFRVTSLEIALRQMEARLTLLEKFATNAGRRDTYLEIALPTKRMERPMMLPLHRQSLKLLLHPQFQHQWPRQQPLLNTLFLSFQLSNNR